MVTHMDRDIGRITDLVKELGLDDNTIVIFSSDNGPTYNRLGGSDSDFFQSAGVFDGLKGSLKEGGIRVPLVARWPGKIKAGSESNHISAFWDVLPTIAELTGTKAPKGIDGVSFAPTLLGQTGKQKKPEYLYWEFAAYGGQQAVRKGKWKALRQNMLRKNKDPLRIFLYDLEADPGESRDVAADHPNVVAEFAAIMKKARTRSELFKFRTLDK